MDNFFNWPVTNNSSHLSDEIISSFEKSMGLECTTKGQVKEPNLCYIESEELRDEYRTRFTQSDILNYIYAMQYSPSLTMTERVLPGVYSYIPIPYPKNSINFWKLTRLGKELKEVGPKDSTLAKELIKLIAEVELNNQEDQSGIESF